MSDQLLKEASKMFENENQWQAACKLADLIPKINSTPTYYLASL